MKRIIVLLLVLASGVGTYFVLREDGLLEQVTEERVEQALLDNRVPASLASCMAPKMTDRLSISQLRKLELLAPEEGEGSLPTSPAEALARLRRVDDDEAVRVLVGTGTTCGLSSLRDTIGAELGL